jgi:hypothetical protein
VASNVGSGDLIKTSYSRRVAPILMAEKLAGIEGDQRRSLCREIPVHGSASTLRLLLWLYIWLLLGEGALRKWIFPHLSGPLLVVRDPVLIAMYAVALARGIFPLNQFVLTTILLAGLSFFSSLCVFGHLAIILYGVRTNFLHLPLIFLIPKVFNRDDVVRLGRLLLLLLIPMTFLVMWQFRAPPGAWINATAGGDLGGQLIASGSHIRPAGTFSFVTGMVCFLGLSTAFLLSGYVEQGILPAWLRVGAIPGLIISLAISGSRAAIASVTVIVTAILIVCSRKLSELRRLLAPAVLGYLAFLALSHASLVQEGLEVQQERFGQGGGIQEGIVGRYLGAFGQSIDVAGRVPLFGFGLGLGTNAGATLLTGSRGFLIAENEWPRVIAESGPVLGYAYLFLRLWICGFLIRRAWLALGRGQSMPIFLVAAAGLDLISGQFGQPTTLGFAVLSAGLSLASSAPGTMASVSLVSQKQDHRIRGRSAVAEAILAQKEI